MISDSITHIYEALESHNHFLFTSVYFFTVNHCIFACSLFRYFVIMDIFVEIKILLHDFSLCDLCLCKYFDKNFDFASDHINEKK